MSEFSFSPITPKEQSQLDRTKREIIEKSKESLEATVACLQSDQFAKYREKYKEGKEELIQAGINLDYSNPVAYAQLAHAIFMRLEFLGKLEDFIQKDLRKVNK